MDRNSPYYKQVKLLVRVLPFVAEHECFALKGGTAINLFVRNMPRLSVDIDLVYLPDNDREAALHDIAATLDRLASSLEKSLAGARVTRSYQDKADRLCLVLAQDGVTIKIELSPVLRGVVYPPEVRQVVEGVESEFGYAEIKVVALEDLYAGKLCAAFDRQHPRDFFDVLLLLENEGITDGIRKAFLVYLVSHQRPMEELLKTQWASLEPSFEAEFKGMSSLDVSVDDLFAAAQRAQESLLSDFTDDERMFLCSIYEARPDWTLLGVDGVEGLPAVKWKLHNIAKMGAPKREASLSALKRVLALKPS
ncbi:MAG: nucleotidyl transferase AbiEii/AbiGii toxin family protein [Alcanivorax sp.]|nr:nucleotidyl transferase AbiEii/AbiGii toxin family protein [Alcanivorax sp.]